ncbi:MAG TPA: FtsX-like permease family protein [Acidobacteriota bacterium]|nr:FtsX-like permease family protein [Acidobacteriota bacterium]
MPNLVKANMLSRKTRSFVSIFGIALSVALLMVAVGLINGNIRDLANRIAYIGADIMVSKDSFGAFYPNELVNDRYAEKIRAVDGVEIATPVLIESTSYLNPKGTERIRQFNYVYGIDFAEYNNVGAGFDFISGGPFEEGEAGKLELIIDRQMAQANKIRLNDTVEMLGFDWKVVGITKEALGARIFVQRDELTEIARPGRQGVATLFYVRATDPNDVSGVVARLKSELGDGWAVRNINDLFSVFTSSALGLREFTIAMIGICAVICFAVILLSMYNSIIERTREIGILKSLGATRRFIVQEILKEALLITAIGIVIGYILTYGGLLLIKNLFPLLEMEMTPDWMIISATIAFVAALLGTLYPASRASRLDPVVALSYE